MTTSKPQTQTKPTVSNRRRIWLFRGAAVVLGFMPLLMFELLCLAAGWGKAELADDPFVGFDSVRPLFVLEQPGRQYKVPAARQPFFNAESFAADKPADEFRIFVLGGSTVHGRPFARQTSLTQWLEIRLNHTDPSRKWRVINCGGVSYASYRLRPILQEVLQHDADLIILYTGHNEFLEDHTFQHIKHRSSVWNTTMQAAASLRSFNVLRTAFVQPVEGGSQQARPLLPTEVQALLDYRGGLEKYHRDDAWQQGVIDQYRYNLQLMVQMARRHKTPLLLINPASNFRDSPPFKSQHQASLTAAEKAIWQQHLDQARKHFQREDYNLRLAAAELENACKIDPLHAGGWYTLAHCYDETGQPDKARHAYLQAKELDVCPLRILQPMNRIVLDLAATGQIPLVDAQQLFEEKSRHGITGSDWFLDHVHPSVRGHQLLAAACADKLASMKLMKPPRDAAANNTAIEAAYAKHLQTIDGFYFQKGADRLRALRNWAAGRAIIAEPVETPPDAPVHDTGS